ncbi:MAG: hypothetical protein LBT90_02685, partial [Holosporaceae bacterium]|jgi:hypothetical protein|nr:hypothetical protein [Holosporaceae bacterium]
MIYDAREAMMADSDEIGSQKNNSVALDTLTPFVPVPESVSFVPITTNFPCFLGNYSNVMAEWPRALKNISADISALHQKQHACHLAYAHTAIDYMSSYFVNLVAFCKSDFCDSDSRRILLSLISLVPRIIEKLPKPSDTNIFIYKLPSSEDVKRLVADFDSFLREVQPFPVPLISSSQMDLFCRVRTLIVTWTRWNENQE